MCCGFEVGVAWWRTSNNTLAAMDEGAGGGGTSAPPRTSKPTYASVLRSRCCGCGWRALGDDSRGCQAADPLLWRPWARWKAASTDTNQGSVAQRRDMILHTARNALHVTTSKSTSTRRQSGSVWARTWSARIVCSLVCWFCLLFFLSTTCTYVLYL